MLNRIVAISLCLAVPAWCGDINFTSGLGSVNFVPGAGSVSFSQGAPAAPSGNSDTFTDSDDTLLATHNSNWVDIGSPYVASQCEVISNAIRVVSDYPHCGVMYNTSSSDVSQIVVKAYTDQTVEKGPCVRAGNGAGDQLMGYCAYLLNASGGNWTEATIYKSGSYLGAFTALSYAQASDHTLKLTASGTSTVTLELFVDGASLGTKTDATSPHTSGKPAFRTRGNVVASQSDVDSWQDY